MAGLQGDSGESRVLAPATSIACDVRASRSAFRPPACCHTRVLLQDELMEIVFVISSHHDLICVGWYHMAVPACWLRSICE